MSANCRRAIGLAAVLLAAGVIDAARHVARADEREELNKACISRQLAAAENQKLNRATIIRYCNCVTKHTFEVFSPDDLAHGGRAGKLPPDLQKQMNAIGAACWSCITNPPCADE
jgi:hypothetical protein